jgi:ribonucleoside-diphosphate reductase alpha chain
MRKKYEWLNKESRTFLSKGYLESGVTPEQRIKQIADAAEKILNIEGFSEKFENYMAMGYYTLATPVFTSFGNDRGYPVSCFGSYIADNTVDILKSVGEIGIMSKMGGGTSAYFGDVRCRGSLIRNGEGGKTDGPVRFMELFDKTADVISQGSNRRGSMAAYLPVEHGDIDEFLNIRSEGNPIQNMSYGVTITRQWMKEMKDGDKTKRKIWSKIIKSRFEKGYPYIMFVDNSNDQAPQVYKDKGLKIKASNLCAEIQLSSDEENSFVCVLSSLNLLHWDEIKENPDIIKTLIYFLDAVNEEFIRKSEGVPFMEKAHNFAKTQRALGAGVLGWHHYLQSKMIAFESMEAKFLNVEIFKTFRKYADEATEELAELYGEPELLKGYGRRNVTTIALPPTTSSAFILGQTSQSIEPENSCYYIQRSAKGTFEIKNPYLEKLLKEKEKDTKETWDSILIKGGSAQFLDCLTQEEKDVFKTFGEISQKEIVIQQIQRQHYIDQTTSLNLMIPHNAKPKDVSELLIFGEENGVKTFYYQRSTSPAQQAVRSILECKSCEG